MATTDQADRIDAINRALHILDITDHDTLCRLLAQTRLNDDCRSDPGRIQERLRNALQAGVKADLYVPYRAAQQVLLAAGQPI